MEKYLIVGIVFAACVLLVIYTQIDASKSTKKLSLREKIQHEFPQYKVIERNENIVICREIAGSRIDDELVLIRIDINQDKNLRTVGKMLIATYKKSPSIREIRKDTAGYV
ncbi:MULTISPECIES: hypothetical protein [unclassified Acinetobacter]|uniref:hypothetical protein n=1 Tax=unclassified Acinetobacter TaxID=196816 RepID=UPI0025751FDD|nr:MULTISPECIES: hypothetical protein [unclassified Acinetobacter]MDM1758201.1 hypothetical protein [Acinetobacter sp. 256-1]MDM1760635.1 hypothetical protein [Acinetobacter sp. 251-1]